SGHHPRPGSRPGIPFWSGHGTLRSGSLVVRGPDLRSRFSLLRWQVRLHRTGARHVAGGDPTVSGAGKTRGPRPDLSRKRGLYARGQPWNPNPHGPARAALLAAVGRLLTAGGAQPRVEADDGEGDHQVLQPLARHAPRRLRPALAEHLRAERAP